MVASELDSKARVNVICHRVISREPSGMSRIINEWLGRRLNECSGNTCYIQLKEVTTKKGLKSKSTLY